MIHKLKVQEKYYNLLKAGLKKIELRLFDEKRRGIKIGDKIEFYNTNGENDCFLAEVVNLHRDCDFVSLCNKISCKDAGFVSNDELISVMKQFYLIEKQKELGVLGIEIKKY